MFDVRPLPVFAPVGVPGVRRLAVTGHHGDMRRFTGLLLMLTLGACGGDNGKTIALPPSTAPGTTTTVDAVNARRTYVAEVQRLLSEGLAVAQNTPESAANGFGWATRAAAYRAVASGMRNLTPPSELRTEHEFLIAEAGALADSADRVSRTKLADMQGAGLVHLQRAKEFANRVESLAR